MLIRSTALISTIALAFSPSLAAQVCPSDIIQFMPGTKAQSSQVNFNFDLLEMFNRDIAMYIDNGDGTFTYDPISGTVKCHSLNKVQLLLDEVFPSNSIDPLTGFLIPGASSISLNGLAIAANSASILSLEGRMTGAEGDILANVALIAALQADVTTLINDLDALELAVADVVAEVGTTTKFSGQTLWSVIDLMSQGHDNQELRIGVLEDAVAAFQVAAVDLQNRVAVLEAVTAQNQLDIAANTAALASLDLRLDALDLRLDALDLRVDALETDLSAAKADILANSGRLDGHDLTLGDHEGRLAVLETTSADHETRITDNEDSINDINITLADHEQRLVDLEYWATLVSPHGQQTFFTDTTWNVPEGVDTFYITVIGAGGGAAKRGLNIPGDFAGGDGASYWKTEVTNVLAGDQVNITIGLGGLSAIGAPSQGATGGSSSVQFVASGLTITADGGQGGIADAVVGGTPGQDGSPLEGMVLRYNGQGADVVLDSNQNLSMGNPGMVLIEW